MEATLLHSCLSLPKVVFALRTCPPVHIFHALQTFDHIMLEALSDLACGPLSNWAWKKVSLPSSLGGLGIRWASLHAPAAYISSLDQSSALVTEILEKSPRPPTYLRGSLSCLAEAASRPEWLTIQEIDVPLHQHSLCHSIDIASYHHLLSETPDSRCRALALSSAISHAGDWLNVVPSSTLGLHLHDHEFRLCLQYWLGLPMVEKGSHCPICLRAVDQFGDHQVGCGGNGDRIHRHDSICDALFSAAQTAVLAPWNEVLPLIHGTRSRPADIFLPIWQRGQPAALDVIVI